jgi:hypothetical protein
MRWWWSRRAPPPRIPPYQVPVSKRETKPPGITVEEHDTSDMTKTGVHRAWKRLTGQS